MFTYDLTDELSLRLIDLGDKQAVYDITRRDSSYLREWLPWVDYIKEVKDTEEFIHMCKKGYAESRSLNAVIVFKGKVVGVAGYNELDWQNKIAYIGYWLAEGYQGNGIMTKVAHGLTKYAFEGLGMNKVDIRAASENYKSRAIPERLGFTEEGMIRAGEMLYGKAVDHVVYGMLKREWEEE
ncbi:GNAT family N-acetyltransferase [Halalkalibacillus halophilus]|uniref:GNAT family N-acetyltransferase n=1 Tax=Halalkalibacillus halophilus TaxID=392827 RepID=UPI0003FC4B94|nr:GNAT family protein [Halalkalibacillus halophilus]